MFCRAAFSGSRKWTCPTLCNAVGYKDNHQSFHFKFISLNFVLYTIETNIYESMLIIKLETYNYWIPPIKSRTKITQKILKILSLHKKIRKLSRRENRLSSIASRRKYPWRSLKVCETSRIRNFMKKNLDVSQKQNKRHKNGLRKAKTREDYRKKLLNKHKKKI